MASSSPRLLYRIAPLRTLHTTYPLHLRDQSAPSTAPPPLEDDFYNLLLSHPTPNSAKKTIKPLRAPKASNPTSSAAVPKPISPPPTTSTPTENRVLFSTPLAGPSARMRGLSRGEKGLGRPPEPDNCCMSGCVNCVWDAYREEVEQWAAGRQRREAEMRAARVRSKESRRNGTMDNAGREGAVSDLDEPGGLGTYEGVDLDDERGLFEGVPVGIREFMKQEKRLRERKLRDDE